MFSCLYMNTCTMYTSAEYQIGGVEGGLQFELLVEADLLSLDHFVCRQEHHEPHCGVCVVLLVITMGRVEGRGGRGDGGGGRGREVHVCVPKTVR